MFQLHHFIAANDGENLWFNKLLIPTILFEYVGHCEHDGWEGRFYSVS